MAARTRPRTSSPPAPTAIAIENGGRTEFPTSGCGRSHGRTSSAKLPGDRRGRARTRHESRRGVARSRGALAPGGDPFHDLDRPSVRLLQALPFTASFFDGADGRLRCEHEDRGRTGDHTAKPTALDRRAEPSPKGVLPQRESAITIDRAQTAAGRSPSPRPRVPFARTWPPSWPSTASRSRPPG
jgi:hypothetical protein